MPPSSYEDLARWRNRVMHGPTERERERKSGRKRRPRFPMHDIRAHSRDVSHRGLRVRFSKLPGETPRHLLQAPLGLPAVLNDFEFEEGATHTEYRTINFGEFSVPVGGNGFHARDLIRLTLEMCTLDWDAPWLQHRGYRPEDVHHTLVAIQRSKQPFRFGARAYRGEDGPFELKIDATLRRYSKRLTQELDTRYYTLEIAEWRDASQRKRSHDPGRGGRSDLPTKHRLDADDTLYSLSKRYYGRHDQWPTLRRANDLGRWGPSTPIVQSNRFKPGDRFKIPFLPLHAEIRHGEQRGQPERLEA